MMARRSRVETGETSLPSWETASTQPPERRFTP
nr:MAG TPA: hypothetical protein [Caudoviricetes sp.]